MTEINDVGAYQTMPMPTTASNTVSQKNDNGNDVMKAVEDNSKTAKLCSYAALGASFATLLPMSVLAVRTGKISKAAEQLEKKMVPILDDVKGVTSVPKDVAESIKSTVNSLGEAVKKGVESEEFKQVITSVKEKINDVDAKALGEKLGETIETLNQKLAEIDVSNLNEETRNIINQIMKKIGNVDLAGQFAEKAIIADVGKV